MSKIVRTSDLVSEDWKSSMDRFGDDLTELILSYLPISDKIRLECTSKQVQSLIYNKQYCLRISDGSEETVNHLNQLLLSDSSNDYVLFGTVLKKFKFLDTIKIEGNITVDSDLIQTIADNCRPLKTLWFYDRSLADRFNRRENDNNINNKCLKSLAQKCGPSLQSLRINKLPEKELRQLLCSLPELRSVTVIDIQSVITEESIFEECLQNSEELPKFLPKLQEIEFSLCYEKPLIQIQNEYSNNILKFSGKFYSLNFNSGSLTQALAGFGRFRCLQSLDLTIFAAEGSGLSIYNGLKQLAAESLQLKQLSFKINGFYLQNKLFSLFSSFKSLSSLQYHGFGNNPYCIRDLRPLTQLKHLNLTLNNLNDLYIKNIDKYLPQLVSIHFNTSKAITDNGLIFLSQMKYLLKLEIKCFTAEEDFNITDYGVKQLIGGCPRIRSISLKQKNPFLDFCITKESIKAMIWRSQQMPKINHYFNCNINCFENRDRFNDISNSLAPNLLIEL